MSDSASKNPQILLPIESLLPLPRYQAADKCRINYSTAKIILRDLSAAEKKCIKRLIRDKERDEKEGMDFQVTCTYADLGHQLQQHGQALSTIEIVARVGHDFFAPKDKK